MLEEHIMNAEEAYRYLECEVKEKPYLVHAKSILCQRQSRKQQNKLPMLNRIVVEYAKYLSVNSVQGSDKNTVSLRVEALNRYYGFIHANKWDNLYSAQTKFRPTILEEFVALLFRDLVKGFCLPALGFGPAKAYANLYFVGKTFEAFAKSPSIKLNCKDQDFSIYRSIEINADKGESIQAKLPVVSVECKTFIDKTMLENSVATAEKIKAGNPYSFFCIVSETYDVGQDVDPAYSRIDQIYVFRKTMRNKGKNSAAQPDIDADVVFGFVSDVKQHLERPWSDVREKFLTSGKVL